MRFGLLLPGFGLAVLMSINVWTGGFGAASTVVEAAKSNAAALKTDGNSRRKRAQEYHAGMDTLISVGFIRGWLGVEPRIRIKNADNEFDPVVSNLMKFVNLTVSLGLHLLMIII